jgi:hypothetical protein
MNLLRGPLGGVGVEARLGAGSLILTPPVIFSTTFLAFFRGGGVAVALHLLAQVLEDPARGPVDES